jgi:hypothetical protein
LDRRSFKAILIDCRYPTSNTRGSRDPVDVIFIHDFEEEEPAQEEELVQEELA